MNKEVCQNYLRGKCRNGVNCKNIHPDKLVDGVPKRNITILGNIDSREIRIRSISGINIPLDRTFEDNYYVNVLNYLNHNGYEIKSINTIEKNIIIHLHK